MGSPVPALTVAVAALWDSGYAVIVGALLSTWWLREIPAFAEQSAGATTPVLGLRLRRVAVTCLGVLIVCHLVRPWFVASSMSGSTGFREALALVPTILSSTRQGGLWYANSLALLVCLGVHWFSKGRAAPTSIWMEIAALCVLAATKAASSHASEEGDFTLAETSQFLHILATSVWAGAIVVSGLIVVPRLAALDATSALWTYGRQLSRIVTWALAALLVSGLYTSWHDMHGHINTLWTGAWGRTLFVKGAFVGFAALLGSLTRFRCLRRPASRGRALTMARLLRSEAAVMGVILCISGLLANTNPGG